jgi:SulP family sulfate permease
MTRISEITDNPRYVPKTLPQGWSAYKINGALFFAAADRVFGELAKLTANHRGILLYMDGVPIIDAGGLSTLFKLISQCEKSGTQLVFADLQFQPLKSMTRAHLQPIPGVLRFYPSLDEAVAALHSESLPTANNAQAN